MIAALSDHPPSDAWTTDDLDALPEDGFRRELLDGALLLSPSPTDIHQVIAMRLGVALEDSCPEDLHVTQAVEVRINPRRAGGHPHYWLIETQGGLHVQTFKLDADDEVSLPSGVFTDVVEATEPWKIKVPVAALRPRHL